MLRGGLARVCGRLEALLLGERALSSAEALSHWRGFASLAQSLQRAQATLDAPTARLDR